MSMQTLKTSALAAISALMLSACVTGDAISDPDAIYVTKNGADMVGEYDTANFDDATVRAQVAKLCDQDQLFSFRELGSGGTLVRFTARCAFSTLTLFEQQERYRIERLGGGWSVTKSN